MKSTLKQGGDPSNSSKIKNKIIDVIVSLMKIHQIQQGFCFSISSSFP